ncbi:LCP family protein [Aetokthonos hydrillicola Thurmond2011]|uniref:LCP family protein n=1 Tax=Aetokthonos hydrillicola Thurmond2011 TaxID=2712845 RepID=A0AAP5IB22_9CYAN|nr:LCP family protein [Aetokthonos hydrillicola]MBO3461625.1 LCP family protein [Aetokthonos hydrillicola CCALA 1050]MBW4589326.1 LCP family protein [Aetokthonos hydrillicola CCALA 1050]MDR9898141.1 LCP family protein [Aetokthonos hydrillicola Thurmond2011]
MVKQIERKEHQGKAEKVQPLQNNGVTAQNQVQNQVKEQHQANNSRNFAQVASSIPTQLYDRLGLKMPRWLFWILSIVVGTTLSGLLVSSLALWTPLWSDVDQSEDDLGFTHKDLPKTPSPQDILSNISQYQLKRPINILVLGIQPVPGSVDGSPESFAGKSNTMLLVRLNPSDKSLRVLSIPKDTMTAIPEKGLNKVADANSHGGPVLAARVMSRTLSNAAIDRYIRISTSGLRQLVDELGGVEVYVARPIAYKDNSGRQINLVKGWQTLNGDQAEIFARFREPGLGDLSRVQRQQALLLALRNRLNSPTIIPKLPLLTRFMRKYFDTNLKVDEAMALVNFSANVERDNLQMTILPGSFSRFSKDPNSYWLNLTGQARLLSEFAGVNIAGMKPDERSLTSLKIAVQNASGQPHKTEKIINYLKQKGFTKVYAMPDSPDPQTQSRIIAQKVSRQSGEELQKVLGFGDVQVWAIGDLQSDVTIRIGKDSK